MKAPRIARCPLRAFASPGCAQGAEKSRRESRVARSALARLADAREGLIRRRWRNLRSTTGASRGRARGTEESRRESCVSRSALSRLTDAHEVLKNAPRITRCPFRAFASRGRARGAESQNELIMNAYTSRLADAREGLKATRFQASVPTIRVSRTRARG